MNRKECIDFRRICDNLTITLFVADADGYVVYVNPTYLERTGLDESSLVGKTIYELQDNNVIRCNIIPKMLKEGKPLNTIGYVIPTNYRGFISGIPVKSDDGHVLYAMTTDWDVHSIVEMESRLRYLKKGEEMPSDNQSLPENKDDEELLYVSELMKEVVSLAKIAAGTDVSVLITGETGVGKEVLSGTIVKYSNRANKPYVKINCAAIPSSLLESELFGYEEGAFTGAKKGGKTGAFEQANGGTILLDEIGELPLQIQAKLLRVLQEGEVVRVGGQDPVKLDVRVIAATNRNLMQEIKKGNFREDLYYRLNVMPLELPPLRERVEDISFLATAFMREFNERYHKNVTIERPALRLLRQYQWPGNIRELRNLVERLVILSTEEQITTENIKRILRIEETTNDVGGTLQEAVADLEIRMIRNAIKKYKNKKAAAEALGVERTTFIKKMSEVRHRIIVR